MQLQTSSSSYFHNQQNKITMDHKNPTINNNNNKNPSSFQEHKLHENNHFPLIKSTLLICLILSFSIFALIVFSSLPSSPHTHLFPISLSSNLPSSSSPSCNSSDPTPGPTQISHILFGLAGSSKTWETRQAYSQLWWDPNNTRGFVWLDDDPPHPKPGSFPPYRVSARARFLVGPGRKPSDRIARIVKESFDLWLPGVRRFVMGDDDTVFFTENLVKVLSKYDYREMLYIGGMSESVEQDVMHGYETAFGGGGFAISYGLACELARILDGCIVRYHNFYGSDEKVSACVAELGVPLTKEQGFHQLDIKGDPYGFLAAHPVAPLVSLHHLVSAKPLFPGRTQMESLKRLLHAYNVDPGLAIQQSFCYDHNRKWSISVSWGYTIQLYPSIISSKVLSIPLQTFRTWRSSSMGPFVFNTRPMKDDPCDKPIIYYLDEVKEVGDGKTVSTYKRAAAADGKECIQPAYQSAISVENFTVSASKTDPEKWIKAPRRECCEIRNSQIVKSNMQIELRSCKLRRAIAT
nr:drought and salt responsive protein 1 [Salicornia brachiata]